MPVQSDQDPEAAAMITIYRFRAIEAAVRHAGYGKDIEWSETVMPPRTTRQFAREVIYVVCNSGMRNSVARPIFERCMAALRQGDSVTTVFGHPGKGVAIDFIWKERKRLFAEYRSAEDKVEFCGELPWIGPVTKYHLVKNFGGNFAKPDVHLKRLADAEDCTSQELCQRLADESGYRAATIDLILWRACADRIINSARYLSAGWDKSFDT
ncbi:MAG: hypothetical protein JWO15_1605 [Sphingomonadales bacterium]|nr:hypothetical protein [Sphingomonadales bacterium]